uniref:holo-ACP synthase n=1 Tax=uncultured Ruthenibacterium sp. TaxID=1905347 RepID=UPI00349E8857
MEHNSFLQRVFGPQELTMFERKKMRAETVAANFAAKEALGKALGEGLSSFIWSQAEALRNEAGAPYFSFSGAAALHMEKNHLRALLSLTHEGDFATAFVVVEQIDVSERNHL